MLWGRLGVAVALLGARKPRKIRAPGKVGLWGLDPGLKSVSLPRLLVFVVFGTRNTNSTTHAKEQRKLAINSSFDRLIYNFNSKINLRAEIHNQYYQTKDKLINNNKVSSENYRFFPMTGIFMETPIRHKEKNLLLTPSLSLIVNGSTKNKNEISNEDSTNQTVSIGSESQLNRFSGTDKLDNSKRILYGLNLTTNNFSSSFSQIVTRPK